ncbi:preprotein translocase subunit SecG [Candidatus Shapirobacteria bacterium CG09_land_8_20_14_0_10_38_17]|uniref:Protein-export membrane protein SecG n=1 Tax=Candidatus Shapirobacteria bacterium CG09_land_8_20_14_0_10_38_17 TaxID=1974884 RepID=A0A2H0WRJ8_9BACT|nr:MAG: preprotein translocase subunit SecG [Candidatus Shapirobacteria bacterium CG09_land_8_20_14_0_10_38_17]
MILYLNIAQIIVSLSLVALILLTAKGSWANSSLSGAPQTKRGPEKLVFNLTIILIVIFIALSIAQLYLFNA